MTRAGQAVLRATCHCGSVRIHVRRAPPFASSMAQLERAIQRLELALR